ncbi:hypothetical protein GCM10028804_60260 [Larkinella terrae]|uniref:DKNYY family protein n=1 Tax=Larkinella terrae TaxID=2025311 RepID=A0A7K0EPL4_9BACT|nr:hypothetical protein [Larkinella terrae]
MVKSADPNTVHFVKPYYFNYISDTTNLFYQDRQLIGADHETFEILNDDYARDERTVYFKDKPLPTGDAGSFAVLSGGYAKDQNQVYYLGNVLKKADPATFKIVENVYEQDAADAHNTFYNGKHTSKINKNQ